MLVGMNGTAIVLAQREAPEACFALFVAVAIALSFAAERLLPYDDGWNLPRGDVGRDWAHVLVNETANSLSLLVLPVMATWNLAGSSLWPTRLPFAVQVLGAVLVFDLGVTLAHLASHRLTWLWRFHAVHHSITRLYGLNGLMKHPVHQGIEMLVGSFPLIALGMPSSVAWALAACTVVQLLLQHSNVDYRVGPFAQLLALNQGHRFHHLKWPEVGDVNFGLFTTVWDRLLGTWSFDVTRVFGSSDLGIAAQPDYPASYLRQLLAPFRRDG